MHNNIARPSHSSIEKVRYAVMRCPESMLQTPCGTNNCRLHIDVSHLLLGVCNRTLVEVALSSALMTTFHLFAIGLPIESCRLIAWICLMALLYCKLLRKTCDY